MTPLEEIEKAICALHKVYEGDSVAAGLTLASLYQARAIERLEATVRAIGVQMQSPAIVRTWRDPHAFAPYAPFPGSPCRCGQPRVDPIHPAELPNKGPQCIECLALLGGQHSPSCHQHGFVKREQCQ